eukprot:CAMPEP_0173111632 /NCGR_PEP_ID=MMETSP1102-20130122/45331_1 /TAXON_ID=49646 /ORGANISM="Geminigera sp., Strain Caron Lab Isolate" /LENGTH=33 /DNA_ID= /DNA_START= /DNA_END= /DNA_ORIENTATION=
MRVPLLEVPAIHVAITDGGGQKRLVIFVTRRGA